MAVAALRELRLQTFKRVYRLDASELCGVVQEASKRRINNREVWDALLYRASLLRGEFRARDLAVTIDSLCSKSRKTDGLIKMYGQNYSYSPPMQSMEHLKSVTHAEIKEEIRIVEAITAALGQEIEMANKYRIVDSHTGGDIFYAVEQTDCITRQLKQCCPDCAAWNVDLLYAGNPAFRLEKAWTATCNLPATSDMGCCFNRPIVTVQDTSGIPVGHVDVDNYEIEFGEVGHPAAKLMVLAVAIFMDFKYFNESSRDDDGGIIGEARIRYKDTAVLDYLLQEVRGKARQFMVRDASLLLNALAKFGLRDELLCQSLLPPLLRRITEKSKWEELSLLALSFARLSDPGCEPIFDQIVASLTPRMNRIDDGHTLSLLACAFTRAMGRNFQIEDEIEDPEGARRSRNEESEFLPLFQTEVGEPTHLAFVELLLEQCDRHIFSFKGSDVLHLSLALVSLVRSNNDDVIPPRLLMHLPKRLNALYYELVPGQFVRFLELFQYLPEIEAACSPRILDELAYRARELLPRSCLPMLRAAVRLNHARGTSVAAWRLTRSDAALGGPAVLTTLEICEVAGMLTQAAAPHRSRSLSLARQMPPGETSPDLLWEAREALLLQLQGLQKRHVDPKPATAATLLSCAAMLLVRDTHWFYLGQNLLAQQPLSPTKNLVEQRPEEQLSEVDFASSLLALARLSFPQLVDAGKLFSRTAMVQSPECAAAVLEAAAIFSLTERKPQDLSSSKLAPMVALMADALRNLPRDDYESKAAALLPRLFPFSGRLATMAGPEVAEWRRLVTTGTTMAVAASTEAARFQEVVLQELSTWHGVELETDLTVGPVHVPFAMSLVQLAAYVRRQHGQLDPADVSDSEELEQPERLEPPEPEDEVHKISPSGRLARRAKRKAERSAMSPSSTPEDFNFADDQISPFGSTNFARPETHLLLQLLRYEDYYHASPSLRGERQRAKGLLLSAERHAEIQLLRQMGWYVICVPEHRWQEESQANREMIFKLVADLTGFYSFRTTSPL
eukprot:s196_g2.t1